MGRALSLILFWCRSVFVCIVRRSEGGSCILLRESRLRTFERVDFVPSMRVEGVAKMFWRPFVVEHRRLRL